MIVVLRSPYYAVNFRCLVCVHTFRRAASNMEQSFWPCFTTAGCSGCRKRWMNLSYVCACACVSYTHTHSQQGVPAGKQVRLAAAASFKPNDNSDKACQPVSFRIFSRPGVSTGREHRLFLRVFVWSWNEESSSACCCIPLLNMAEKSSQSKLTLLRVFARQLKRQQHIIPPRCSTKPPRDLSDEGALQTHTHTHKGGQLGTKFRCVVSVKILDFNLENGKQPRQGFEVLSKQLHLPSASQGRRRRRSLCVRHLVPALLRCFFLLPKAWHLEELISIPRR